eukprot:GHVU01146570.1.p1 GENE.GHVU01146570.1~~GHVU01146570.1.p1  ORF type:complete len:303 (+),score=76.07 GHVU01146570.1:21-929(+)
MTGPADLCGGTLIHSFNQLLLECAEQYLKCDRLQLHMVAVRLAALLALQLKYVQEFLVLRADAVLCAEFLEELNPEKSEVAAFPVITSMSLQDTMAFVEHHHDFVEALTVAQASEHLFGFAVHAAWPRALLRQVVIDGNSSYLTQYLSEFPLDHELITTLVDLYISMDSTRWDPSKGCKALSTAFSESLTGVDDGAAIDYQAYLTIAPSVPMEQKAYRAERLKGLLVQGIENLELRLQVARRLGDGFQDVEKECCVLLDDCSLYPGGSGGGGGGGGGGGAARPQARGGGSTSVVAAATVDIQ